MLKGKTIVVTGAASGIGAETVREIRASGGKVIAVDIKQPTESTDHFIQADLSQRESIDELVAALPSGVNGLANIAGLPPTRPPEQVLAVNLVGLKYLTRNLVPKLAENSSIVNVASLAGIGWPDSLEAIKASESLDFDEIAAFCSRFGIDAGRSYFFSKEALIVWTIQNRWTWRHRSIRINAISPGPVDTPILPDFIKTLGRRAEQDMKVMDRPGRPNDIAPIIAFLLSDGSKWIRGTNIPTDGGMHAHVQSQMYSL